MPGLPSETSKEDFGWWMKLNSCQIESTTRHGTWIELDKNVYLIKFNLPAKEKNQMKLYSCQIESTARHGMYLRIRLY